jgi:hypothetical protein
MRSVNGGPNPGMRQTFERLEASHRLAVSMTLNIELRKGYGFSNPEAAPGSATDPPTSETYSREAT